MPKRNTRSFQERLKKRLRSGLRRVSAFLRNLIERNEVVEQCLDGAGVEISLAMFGNMAPKKLREAVSRLVRAWQPWVFVLPRRAMATDELWFPTEVHFLLRRPFD